MSKKRYSDINFDKPEDGWIYIRVNRPKDVDILYEKTREFTTHEDGLVNQRLVWMLTFNGFLFTAYALSLTAESTARIRDLDLTIEAIAQLRDALTVAGFASAFVAAFGVLGALKAIRSAAHHYNDVMWSNRIRPFFPRIIGRRRSNVLGMICAVSTPFMVSGPWMYLFLKNREFTQGVCEFSQGQVSAAFALIATLSCVVIFSSITVFPELPDPFKEPSDRSRKQRQEVLLIVGQFAIVASSIFLFVEIWHPNISAQCEGALDKSLTTAGLILPTVSIMVFVWLFGTSPFRKKFDPNDTHLHGEVTVVDNAL